MEIQQRVRQFISENFYVSDATALTNDASLIAAGVVDSTGMLEVITFLESEYRISIDDTEMTPENLETIGRIARFVAQKQAAAAR
jgi:acyl carrier protein